MSESQKNNIEKLLKQKNKSKRELAAFLDVHENGINRILDNRNISLKRLEEIAEFLAVDISVLLKSIYPNELGAPKIYRSADFERSDEEEELVVNLFKIIENQQTINQLERKNGEILTQIMNSYIPEKS